MTRQPAIRVPITRDVDMQARLLSKAIPAPSGCLIWVAAVDGHGYGLVRQPGYKSMRPAHRAAYELLHGEIPPGMHLDHLCRDKKCINPQHLQVVTPQVNVLRAGNPGHRITRVLTGRQSRKAPSAAVLREMNEFAASLGVADLPDVATGAAEGPAPVVDLCPCGKPATHLAAPEDSDDWACLVRDAGDYTPPAWLRDERWHPSDAAVYGRNAGGAS